MLAKKILSKTLSIALMASILTGNLALAETIKQPNAVSLSVQSKTYSNSQVIPYNLEKNIKDAIMNLYGKENTDKIYKNILNIAEKAKNERTLKLKMDDYKRVSDWYKDEVIYMFYADQFGVKNTKNPNTFKDLIGMLDYLEDLGVTTLYILPFMDSPMGDAGFDVRDPKNVRKDLGGTEEFQKFAQEARKRGFKIKADLILNHFSDQHEWFQQAIKGDKEKINYFVVSETPPKYKKYRDEQKGIVVDYEEKDGKISSRRLIFADICENHYRKVNINGKDYYFYHTFYPFQLDINWKNPKVLYEILDVIADLSNMGIDIFRMDAIPYFVKESGTDGENSKGTHEVVKILSGFLQSISPRTIIQAEACQWPKDILPYFGNEQETELKLLGQKKQLRRTDEVQVAYNFPYMPAIWASMLTENNSHFWNAYAKTPEIPSTAAWGVFLRVHDELTLEMVDVKTRKLIYDKLITKGAEFRKGLGVSGRISEFLDKNPNRIALAYSVLLSLPGIPIIYYGDEIGAPNNWDYAKESAKIREKTQKEKNGDLDVISFFDSRDINRGPITKDSFYSAKNNKDKFSHTIYSSIKNLINIRKENPLLTRGDLKEIKADNKAVFSYLRELDGKQMLVVNNLSDKTVSSKLKLSNIPSNELINLINKEKVNYKKSKDGIKVTIKPFESLWIPLN